MSAVDMSTVVPVSEMKGDGDEDTASWPGWGRQRQASDYTQRYRADTGNHPHG
jgi:hypothetical protein